jgi:hypothetical protein
MTDQNIVAVNQIVRRVEVTTPGPAGRDGTDGSAGVSKIIAGTSNVTLSPTGGTGDVTVSVAGDGTGTVTEVLATSPIVSDGSTTTPTISHATALPIAGVYNYIYQLGTDIYGHITSLVGQDAATFRGGLGLKSTAITDMGTTADKVVQLDSSARLPAVDGSQLTNLPAGDPTSGYTGQTSITTLGTIATGTWDGTTIAVDHGGTGSTTAPMIGVVTAADAGAARTVLELGVDYVNTAPSSPNVGDIWFNSDAGIFSAYVNDGGSSQWVDISGQTGATPVIENSYTGQIETIIEKTYTIDPGVVAGRTITSFYARSGAGTCTATLYNAASVVGIVSVTTSSTTATISNTTVPVNNALTIVITTNIAATDVVFSVEFTQ